MFFRCLSLVCIAMVVASSAEAQTALCVKKRVAVRNGRLLLSKNITSTTSTCPPGTVSILSTDSPAELLTKLQGVDGSGSSLDADTLDGSTKDEFALASALTTLNTTSTGHETRITSLEAGTTAAQILSKLLGVDGSGSTLDADLLDGSTKADFALAADLNSLNTTVTSLNSTSTNHENRLSTVEGETRVANVVRVATAGGDYSSLGTALDSLSSPSLSNPYLVLVGPGTFVLNDLETLSAGVTVRGAGIDRTILSASRTSTTLNFAGVLNMSNGSALENLTVENTSSGSINSSVGVFLNFNSESNRTNQASIDTVIRDVRVRLSGVASGSHYGVYCNSCDAILSRLLVDVEGSTIENTGIQLTSSQDNVLHVRDSFVYVATATLARALNVSSGPSSSGTQLLAVQNSRVYSDKIALRVSGTNARATVVSSVLTASVTGGTAVSVTNGAAIINNTTVDAFDNASNSGGTLSCAFIAELGGGGYPAACE